MGGVATYRQFKKLVVLGITAHCNAHIDVHPFGLPRQGCKKRLNIVLINVSLQVLSVQNFVQFSENCKGKQKLSFSEGELKSLTRL